MELSQKTNETRPSQLALSASFPGISTFPIYNHAIQPAGRYTPSIHRFERGRLSSLSRVATPLSRLNALGSQQRPRAPRPNELHARDSDRILAMAPKYGLSDSELESEADTPAVPSDEVLKQGLRDEVAAIFKSGNMEELTVKRVRLAAEKKLGLEEGFFKSTGDWKTRSDQIIKDEVVRSQSIANARGRRGDKY